MRVKASGARPPPIRASAKATPRATASPLRWSWARATKSRSRRAISKAWPSTTTTRTSSRLCSSTGAKVRGTASPSATDCPARTWPSSSPLTWASLGCGSTSPPPTERPSRWASNGLCRRSAPVPVAKRRSPTASRVAARRVHTSTSTRARARRAQWESTAQRVQLWAPDALLASPPRARAPKAQTSAAAQRGPTAVPQLMRPSAASRAIWTTWTARAPASRLPPCLCCPLGGASPTAPPPPTSAPAPPVVAATGMARAMGTAPRATRARAVSGARIQANTTTPRPPPARTAATWSPTPLARLSSSSPSPSSSACCAPLCSARRACSSAPLAGWRRRPLLCSSSGCRPSSSAASPSTKCGRCARVSTASSCLATWAA